MRLLETVRIALRGLRANKLRSALTTLGIVIGVAAVIALTALGNGVQAGVSEDFGQLATQIIVTPEEGGVAGTGQSQDLTDSDAEALSNPRRTPSIASVTPVASGSTLMQVGRDQYQAQALGTTADYLTVTDRELVVGRGFTESDVRRNARVVVLGPNPVQELFGGNATAALNQEVRIGRAVFRVIGVAESTGQQDNVAIMPIDAARSYLLGGGDDLQTLVVRSTSSEAVPAAVNEINAILDDRHNIREPAERDFNVQAQQTFLEQANQTLSFLTLFTGAVAGISLIVGSIGVANIMLVTVTERTREIGIRKAIGAPRSAILQQFLLEATILSGLGGLLGIAIGVGLSVAGGVILPQLVPDFPEPTVSIPSVLLAFGVSLAIGLVAGVYPANRAARLRPIEALRYQ